MHGGAPELIRTVVSSYGCNTKNYDNLILISPRNNPIKDLSIINNGTISVALDDENQFTIN